MFCLIKKIRSLLGLEKPKVQPQPITPAPTIEPASPVVQPTVVQVQENDAVQADALAVTEKPKRQRKPKVSKDPAIATEPKAKKTSMRKKKESVEKPSVAE